MPPLTISCALANACFVCSDSSRAGAGIGSMLQPHIVKGEAGEFTRDGLIDAASFTKFCKETPGLLKHDPTKLAMDVTFSRNKGKGTRGLTVAQFGLAIVDLANSRLGDVKKHYRATGKAARALKLTLDYIMKAKGTKEWAESLHRAALLRVDGAARVLQHWANAWPARRARCRNSSAGSASAWASPSRRSRRCSAVPRRAKSSGRRRRVRSRSSSTRSRARRTGTTPRLAITRGTSRGCWCGLPHAPSPGPLAHGRAAHPRLRAACSLQGETDVLKTVYLPPQGIGSTELCGYCDDLLARRECLECDQLYCEEDYERYHLREGVFLHWFCVCRATSADTNLHRQRSD